jgi:hypothetical protein
MVTDADAVTVTTDEAARIASVSARTIRRWIQRGILPAKPTQDGYLVATADLAGVQAAAGQRSRSRGHAVTDPITDAVTTAATDMPVTVNPNARAQLEAIRDEWLQPLVATISQQAERIGRLEAEQESISARLAAKDEIIGAKDELIADLRAEFHRRAERDRAGVAQTVAEALRAQEAHETASSSVWGWVRRWWRG